MNRPTNRPTHPMQRLSLVAVTTALSFLCLGADTESDASAPADRPAASASAPAADGRVIVLGFDGADARTIRELMAADPGAFPTFEKLASEGTFAPLEVVAPPESPVSWAALNTGQNPAKTGVPGFIKRNLEYRGRPSNPFPGFGHIVIQEIIPIEEFENTPIPTWSPGVLAGIAGVGCFGVCFLLGLLVSGRRFPVALVLGFLGGSAGAYSGMTVRGLLPDSIEVTGNPNKAVNFWDVAGEAGVRSIILDSAQSFSMPTPPGTRVLSGLGVPDARGALGDWFVYTTNPDETQSTGRKTTTAGHVFRVDARDGEIEASIFGPKNFWVIGKLEAELAEVSEKISQPDIQRDERLELSKRETELKEAVKEAKNERTNLPLSIVIGTDEAKVSIGGQEQTVRVGEWSEFYDLTFEINWLIDVKAITRVRLVKTEPYFELFVNVLDIDPRDPPFWQPLSSPPEFAAELAGACGPFETYGWPTLTMPVKDGEVDAELLMEDVEFTMKWRERLTASVLERDDWRILMSVFSTTDRVQHMMYRYWDEAHPQYDAAESDREMTFFGETIKLRDAIPSIYKQMDRVMGDVLAKLNANDTLIVISDHGFQSFRRQVNVNNWLIEQGYLAIKPGTTSKTASFLKYADWKKTKVYSLGMGFLYVNQIGREKGGIVPASEVDALMAEVREKLLAATDQDTGAPICRDVYITKEIHNGPYLDLESDMIIGFAPTYRVSWSSTSGGISMKGDKLNPVCTNNTSPWSGGHISVNLPDVAGVFFCNRKVDVPTDGIKALQIAPTVLDLVGVPKLEAMDLESLSIE